MNNLIIIIYSTDFIFLAATHKLLESTVIVYKINLSIKLYELFLYIKYILKFDAFSRATYICFPAYANISQIKGKAGGYQKGWLKGLSISRSTWFQAKGTHVSLSKSR